MRVLIACEFSGIVRDAFINKGHNAISCDLLESDNNGPHYKGDVLKLLDDKYDLMIAHPPCTYLCNSGVRWLKNCPDRMKKMIFAAKFFRRLLDCDIYHIAVENPIMHKYAVEIIGRRQDQIVQPFQFGHLERKSTCLWLKNLPKLRSTDNVFDEMMKLPKNKRERLHYLPPSNERWKERSKTYKGIADAMAEQWG